VYKRQVTPIPGGYAVEVAVSWKSLGVNPGADVGLDVRVHDDDDGGPADAAVGWVSESVSPVFTLAYGTLTTRK
jgi:hypothetical protein